jgi:hypothetical protein
MPEDGPPRRRIWIRLPLKIARGLLNALAWMPHASPPEGEPSACPRSCYLFPGSGPERVARGRVPQGPPRRRA